MRTRRVYRRQRPATAVLTALLALATCAAAREPWHASAMPHRLQLAVVPAARRGGIDTALVNLGEQSKLCRPDGADICVTTPSGEAVPHRVEVRENAAFDVLIRVPTGCDRFYLYYGSGRAEAAASAWTENLGGLYLETRPIDQPVNRAAELPAAMRRYTARFDRKPWKQIWDQENPFGRDDLYLSIYEGTLYCPRAGRYTFAINSDDSSFFGIDGVADPLCWREAGVSTEAWRDPNHPRAARDVTLEKGVYRIRYCHVENYGGQLAQLGWQTPAADAIVVVPPDAFIRYLPAEIQGRELRDESLSPFFTATHCYTVKVNGLEPGFPRYRFEARVAAVPEEREMQFLWDFGDGTTGSGREVEHEFAAGGAQTVALTVRDGGGREASITRPVPSLAWPVSDVVLRLEVRAGAPFVPAGGPLRLQTLAFTQGGAEQQFELAVSSSREGGHGGAEGEKVHARTAFSGAVGGREKWSRLETVLPVENDMHVAVSARLHGVEVAREDLAVLGTDGVLRGLRLDGAQDLRREDGALVVLRAADAMRAAASPRCVCEPDSSTVDVLVFDEVLGGPRGSAARSYADFLARALGQRYEGLTFAPRRAEPAAGDTWSPMGGFLHVAAELGRTSPNLVILACQPDSVINGVPLDEFEQALGAAVDQVLVRSRAEVILVGPPPLPGRPEASWKYALIAKRMGLRKGVAVVDLYSRFRLTPDWEALFQPAGGAGRTFLLYPNEQGQELIAREILAAVVEGCHEGLSTAVRHASFMPAGGGP